MFVGRSSRVLGFILIVGIVLSVAMKKDNAPRVQGRSPVLSLPVRGLHGRGSDRAEFRFVSSAGTSYLLHYVAGEEGGDRSVEVELNGVDIEAGSPIRIERPGEERVPLPPAVVRAGENRLLFRQRVHGALWSVRDIYLTRLASPNERSIGEAGQLLAVARRFYETRESRAGNLWRAAELLERARRLIERGDLAMDADITRLWTEVDGARNRCLDDGSARVMQALRTRQFARAREILRQLRAEFPDDRDPRSGRIAPLERQARK